MSDVALQCQNLCNFGFMHFSHILVAMQQIILSENCILWQVLYKVSLAEINRHINDQLNKFLCQIVAEIVSLPPFANL